MTVFFFFFFFYFTLVERSHSLQKESSSSHICYGCHSFTGVKAEVCITDSPCSAVYLLLLGDKTLCQEALNCIKIITNKK